MLLEYMYDPFNTCMTSLGEAEFLITSLSERSECRLGGGRELMH